MHVHTGWCHRFDIAKTHARDASKKRKKGNQGNTGVDMREPDAVIASQCAFDKYV